MNTNGPVFYYESEGDYDGYETLETIKWKGYVKDAMAEFKKLNQSNTSTCVIVLSKNFNVQNIKNSKKIINVIINSKKVCVIQVSDSVLFCRDDSNEIKRIEDLITSSRADGDGIIPPSISRVEFIRYRYVAEHKSFYEVNSYILNV